jgi:hypothetical protein
VNLSSYRRRAAAVLIGMAVLAWGPAARAAIAPGSTQSGSSAPYSGNGELFFSAFDAGARISYTLDLGVQMGDPASLQPADFFVWGQQDGGNQRFWVVGDDRWTSFLAQVSVIDLRWSVLALDTTGGLVAGGIRLFSTARQGDEAKIATMSNQALTNGTGSTQAGTFFTAVNTTGTHGQAGTAPDFAVNGSSINADPEPGNGYFGSNSLGLSTTLNGNAPFDSSNAIGQSSWFYYLTRSGTNQLGTVLVDEFDNLGHDGYWGFTFVDAAKHPESPYAGQYLLSFTMASYTATIAQREFAFGIGRTESSGGFAVARLPGVAARGFESPAGWTRRLGGLDSVVATAPAAPVPEPGSWLLAAAGLPAVAWCARRRRRA